MQQPIVVYQNTNREQGKRAQASIVLAVKTLADVMRTCLGPSAMFKLLIDPMGGLSLTNDGQATLREIDVVHPAAKNAIELSRTQDEECGDGTTSVVVLLGEIMAAALPFLERNIHANVIISAFNKVLDDAMKVSEEISQPINLKDREQIMVVAKSVLGTKMSSRWETLMCNLAMDAVEIVSREVGQDGVQKEIDLKRYARIEKIPGGQVEQSHLLRGVILNKDVTHPKMRRYIENPRVILLDCPLEYKKGESQTNIEISKEADWNRILQIEEEQVKKMCDQIIALKPDLVFTEKGVSDLAQHYLLKANITAIRRVRKMDNNRIARAVGATIVNYVEDIKESDVGNGCGVFRVEKIGDEYFTILNKCTDPKACSIVLRGPTKDILNEIERNLQDCMQAVRNVHFNPRMCPGGGATEMAISTLLSAKAKTMAGAEQLPYAECAKALEVIPRTLIQNSGEDPLRVLTKLSAKHAKGEHTTGVDGINGKVVDMKKFGIWEPLAVKQQSIKSAIEAAAFLLRIDDIISSVSKKDKSGGGAGMAQGGPDGEDGNN
ncbi:T-complex protein 1 subunit gamma [Ramicandelaber brevisporus]|nr:T-complex protein 1 subunit gamma [Ramicandelaber brevisporus]